MRTTILRRLGAMLAAALLLPVLAAPAAHAWMGTIDVPGSQVAGASADLVVAPDGTATAAWLRYDQAGAMYVDVSTRPPGGVFGPRQTLAAEPNATSLRVAVDAAGTVTLAWIQRNPDTDILRSASRPAGGAFSPPRDVSDTGSSARDPQLAAAGTTAVLTWVQQGRIRAAIATGAEPFAVQKPLTPVGDGGELPQVAVSPNGAAVVAWTREHLASATYRVRAAARTPGEDFAPLAEVRQTPLPIEHLHAAMSATGRATLAWKRDQDTGHLPQRLETAARGVSGNFGAPGEVPGATAYVEGDFALAVSPEDTAMVASTDMTPAVAVRPSGSGFNQMKIISSEAGTAARVRFVDGEHAMVGWKRLGLEYVAPVAPDGTVGPKQVMGEGAAGQLHGLASDDQGSVADWWVVQGGKMRLSVLDAGAPALGVVSVPATGMSGQPLPMNATATDRWSIVSTSWQFGDGATAAGASVAHAYAKPGAYTVTVTATDAIGHATTETRTVTVRGRTTGPRPDPGLDQPTRRERVADLRRDVLAAPAVGAHHQVDALEARDHARQLEGVLGERDPSLPRLGLAVEHPLPHDLRRRGDAGHERPLGGDLVQQRAQVGVGLGGRDDEVPVAALAAHEQAELRDLLLRRQPRLPQPSCSVSIAPYSMPALPSSVVSASITDDLPAPGEPVSTTATDGRAAAARSKNSASLPIGAKPAASSARSEAALPGAVCANSGSSPASRRASSSAVRATPAPRAAGSTSKDTSSRPASPRPSASLHARAGERPHVVPVRHRPLHARVGAVGGLHQRDRAGERQRGERHVDPVTRDAEPLAELRQELRPQRRQEVARRQARAQPCLVDVRGHHVVGGERQHGARRPGRARHQLDLAVAGREAPGRGLAQQLDQAVSRSETSHSRRRASASRACASGSASRVPLK